MKMKNVVMMAVVGSFLFASIDAANATIVDFSSMGTVANYSGNADFNVTTYGGAETDIDLRPHIVFSYDDVYLVNSSDPLDVSREYPTEDIIDFDFGVGLDSIDVTLFWAGNNGYGMSITSYDQFDNPLQTFGYLDGKPTYSFDSTELIYSVRTDSKAQSVGGIDWWYGVSAISYTAVPEPASIGLLGLVSGGIYFSRRFFMI
jgi:hypothetical protein